MAACRHIPTLSELATSTGSPAPRGAEEGVGGPPHAFGDLTGTKTRRTCLQKESVRFGKALENDASHT